MADRQYAKKLGRLGEKIALKYLRQNGYKFLFKNFSLRGGELDLIMSNQGKIIFFEIKTRRPASTDLAHIPKFGLPDEQISWHQRITLIHAARAYLHLHNLSHSPWQFDLISINLELRGDNFPKAKITHLQNIFTE